jgi:predicted glycoside hydrolase/deacetylase ChbG (UPF0249 family)
MRSVSRTNNSEPAGPDASTETRERPAPHPPERNLIVNGDDFGRSDGVNRGVIQAHESGILTSASIMVRWPASDHAVAYALAHPDLSVGIHLDLGEWYQGPDGWEPVYEVVPLAHEEGVRDEIARQLGRFHKLMGRSPTHIDSHQHVHREEPVASIAAEFGRRLSCPVRHIAPGISYCGDFYGQSQDGSSMPDAISTESLIRLLDRLPPGITELACHPGQEDDLDSVYALERRTELRALCDPVVRDALNRSGIALIAFNQLLQVPGKGAEPVRWVLQR